MMNKRLNPIDITYFANKVNAERTYYDNELVALSFSVARLEDFSYLIEEFFIDEIQTFRTQVAELEEWKNEATKVESKWDCQAIGKALNIPLGHSIRANILPKIEALSLQVQVLREALGNIHQWYDGYSEHHINVPTVLREIDNIATEALSTTPKQDEWIRKDTLEMVATLKRETRTVFSPKKTEYPYTEVDYFIDENLLDGDYKLYRIKETTK